MSSPAEWYHSLPPISKAYGTTCLVFTTLSKLGILQPYYVAMLYPEVFKQFQIWRLFTTFLFLGNFSINFGIRLLMMCLIFYMMVINFGTRCCRARYGVQLEQGPFARRTADFLWMMIFGALTILVLSLIPGFENPFLGVSLVFMLLYVWSREYPNAQISLYGLMAIKAFYLPWAMLGLDVIFGSSPIPDLLGIVAGHLYYFLTVLHPLSGGKDILKTPRLVNKLVARWRIGAPPVAARGQQPPTPERTTGSFSGRAYRLSD